MIQLNEKQMTNFQLSILVLIAIGLQLLLYSQFFRYLPYPLFVSKPKLGMLFFLVYTIIFFGSIISGIALGFRYLPRIVMYLVGTTLALWIPIAIFMTIGSTVMDKLIKNLQDVSLIILTEEAVPSVIWAMIGGICGSFLHLLLRQQIGVVYRHSKFLRHISVAIFITIIVFSVVSFLLSEFLVFGGSLIFVGIAIGFIVQDKAILIAVMSQIFFGLVVVVWMLLTAHGEGRWLILPTLFVGVPISIFFGVIGTPYGKYLRNHFLVKP